MKTNKSIVFLMIIVFLISCDKENLLDQIVDFNDMPGKHITLTPQKKSYKNREAL